MPNDNFIWTDETVKEFMRFYDQSTEVFYGTDPRQIGIEKFKQSKIKEKEPIYVVSYMSNPKNTNGYPMEFTFTRELKDVGTVINALESFLNDEPIEESQQEKAEKLRSEVNAAFMEKFVEQPDNHPLSGELITKEECERREEDAFWAGKHGQIRVKVKDENGFTLNDIRFTPTYEDYKKSQPK